MTYAQELRVAKRHPVRSPQIAPYIPLNALGTRYFRHAAASQCEVYGYQFTARVTDAANRTAIRCSRGGSPTYALLNQCMFCALG